MIKKYIALSRGERKGWKRGYIDLIYQRKKGPAWKGIKNNWRAGITEKLNLLGEGSKNRPRKTGRRMCHKLVIYRGKNREKVKISKKKTTQNRRPASPRGICLTCTGKKRDNDGYWRRPLTMVKVARGPNNMPATAGEQKKSFS